MTTVGAGEAAAGLLLVAIGLLLMADRLTWLIRLLPPSLQRFAW